MMITAFLCVLSTINANRKGAPLEACQKMKPQHGTGAQSSVAPYNISVEPMHYSSGTTVTVNLTSSSTQFKGYLLQMRRIDNNKIIAGFSIDNGGQLLACDDQNNTAVTHTNNSEKTDVSFTWTAPAQSEGSLQVIATVVQSKLKFWTMIKSNIITASQTTTPAGGQATTTSSNSAAFTVSSFLGILGAVVITVLML